MAYLYGEDEEMESLYGGVPVPTPPTTSAPRSTAREELRALDIQGPPQAPNPKWWQRLAAGAAAFGQGYVNAGGRVHIPQENIDATTEAIMAPAYRQQLGQYQTRREGLREVAGMERQGEQDAMRRSESEARIASEQAQMEAARAAAARANRPDTPRPVTPPSTEEARLVRILDDPNATPEQKAAAQKRLEALNAKNPGAAPRETPEQATIRRTREADAQSLKGRDRTEFILTGRLPRPARPSSGGQPPRAPQSTFKTIEAEKQNALARAKVSLDARLKEESLDKGYANAEGKAVYDQIMAEHQATLQQIQDAYEAKIEAAGATATHSDVASWSAKPAAPAAPAPTARGTVKMRAPNGQVKDVAPEDVAHYSRLGATVVSQ